MRVGHGLSSPRGLRNTGETERSQRSVCCWNVPEALPSPSEQWRGPISDHCLVTRTQWHGKFPRAFRKGVCLWRWDRSGARLGEPQHLKAERPSLCDALCPAKLLRLAEARSGARTVPVRSAWAGRGDVEMAIFSDHTTLCEPSRFAVQRNGTPCWAKPTPKRERVKVRLDCMSKCRSFDESQRDSSVQHKVAPQELPSFRV